MLIGRAVTFRNKEIRYDRRNLVHDESSKEPKRSRQQPVPSAAKQPVPSAAKQPVPSAAKRATDVTLTLARQRR